MLDVLPFMRRNCCCEYLLACVALHTPQGKLALVGWQTVTGSHHANIACQEKGSQSHPGHTLL